MCVCIKHFMIRLETASIVPSSQAAVTFGPEALRRLSDSTSSSPATKLQLHLLSVDQYKSVCACGSKSRSGGVVCPGCLNTLEQSAQHSRSKMVLSLPLGGGLS